SLVILKFVGGLPWAALRHWADGQLFEFVMGCVVGWLYVKGHLRKIGTAGAGLAIALGVAGLLVFGVYHSGATRLFVAGIPSAFLVMGAVSLEEGVSVPTVPAAKFLGDASYSIYLTHLLPIALLGKAWTFERLPHDAFGSALLFSALSIALGIA